MTRLVFTVAVFALGCGEKAKAPGNGTIIPTHGRAMVHSDGPSILDGDDQPLNLRCVNIDGWLQPIPYLISDSGHALLTSPSGFAARLEEVVGEQRASSFWREYRDRFLTEADFRRMAELGFNCARLPLYHRFADEDALERIDSALAWGLEHNVYVVLDLHSVPGGQNALPTVSDVSRGDEVARLWEGPDAASNQEETIEIWRGLAERYAGHPALAGYDMLNEPALPSGIDPAVLPELYGRIASAIREVDDLHMLFVEGDALAHDFSAFQTPVDANMAYEFHAYALTGFEDWATPDPSDLDAYTALRADQDRPLWLGEFGEKEIEWQVGMIELVESEDIGWALYPWKRKQTWFLNPVLQRIEATPEWYALAAYMAQPDDGAIGRPTAEFAEVGMAELLEAVTLENCQEDGATANRLFGL